ncbi:segregation/condensation protein A [Halanaerocella petrolearia]
MSYEVKVESFEGPIDLLLHLLNKNEVEIYDIQIAEITEQYLNYIATMQRLDLDVASEFLVMAAKLMEIKAQNLLPSKKQDENDDDEEKDPRQQLVERLLEYKKYKNLASKLQNFEEKQQKSYTRNVAPLLGKLEFEEENPLEDVELTDFVGAFQKVLARHEIRQEETKEEKEKEEKGISHLNPEEVTIEEQQGYIMQQVLNQAGNMTFVDLFSDLESKLEIVVTFMALLELIKLKELRIEQEDSFATIKIYHVRSGSDGRDRN